MKRVQINCGWLVTLDTDIGDFRNGEILINGNRIEAVGRNLNATADEVIDASDKIVMPGLVNAHMHTWETALRGIGAEWLSARLFQERSRQPRHPLPGRRTIIVGDLIGALAQIDAGVTTLVDWCHNITVAGHGRTRDRRACGQRDPRRVRPRHGKAAEPSQAALPFTHLPHPRERIEALRKGRLASDDDRITLAMAILGPDYWGSGMWSSTISAWRVSSAWFRRPIRGAVKTRSCPDGYARMAKAGLLGPDHNLVTARATIDADLRSLVDNGATLTSTVLVELASPYRRHDGRGLPGSRRQRRRSASMSRLYCTGHMFREMQAALLFARGKEIRNNVLRGNSHYKTMPVRSREALEWATINGARAFGLDRQDRHADTRQEGRHRHAARRRRQHGAGL